MPPKNVPDHAVGPREDVTRTGLYGGTRARRFLFTMFDGAPASPPNISRDPAIVRFFVYQTEVCPTTGRPHFQGYVELMVACRYTKAVEYLGGRACHLEIARGTAHQCIKYCTKEETRHPESTIVRWGTPAEGNDGDETQKKLTMKMMIADIRAGMQEEAVLDKYPTMFLTMMPKIRELIGMEKQKLLGSSRDVYVEVRCGSPGTGKTYSVFEPSPNFDPPLPHYESKYVFLKRDPSQWFDGYSNQEVLVLDDFYPTTDQQADWLLSWFDKYTCKIQVKGGHVTSAWRHVILTCNIVPDLWWVDWSSYDPGRSVAVQKDSLRYKITPQKRNAVLDRIINVHIFEGASRRHEDEIKPRPWVPPPPVVAAVVEDAEDDEGEDSPPRRVRRSEADTQDTQATEQLSRTASSLFGLTT